MKTCLEALVSIAIDIDVADWYWPSLGKRNDISNPYISFSNYIIEYFNDLMTLLACYLILDGD